MKKPAWMLLLALCVASPLLLLMRHRPEPAATGTEARQVHEEATPREPISLEGEVLDVACYLDNDLHGSEHRSCAAACLKDGQPIGLLGERGEVFLLIEDHMEKAAYRTLKNLAAERVLVRGELIRRGGLQSIVVRGVERPAGGGGDPAAIAR